MKYLLKILPSVIIIALFYTFAPSDFNLNARKEIKMLKAQNDSLQQVNHTLGNKIQTYREDLLKTEEIIQTLYSQQTDLEHKIDSLNKKITNLNHKYEQAKNHANNFSSDDIIRYFSNFDQQE